MTTEDFSSFVDAIAYIIYVGYQITDSLANQVNWFEDPPTDIQTSPI